MPYFQSKPLLIEAIWTGERFAAVDCSGQLPPFFLSKEELDSRFRRLSSVPKHLRAKPGGRPRKKKPASPFSQLPHLDPPPSPQNDPVELPGQEERFISKELPWDGVIHLGGADPTQVVQGSAGDPRVFGSHLLVSEGGE